MPRIDVPGKGIVEFPDSMNDDQIINAIKVMGGGGEVTPEMVAGRVAKNFANVIPNTLQAIDDVAYEAGGRVTDWTGSPAAGAITNGVIQAGLPVGAVAKGAAGATKAMRGLAESLMRGSLGASSKDLLQGKAQRAAQTFLDRLELPTEGGIGRFRELASSLNKKVDAELASSGATVRKSQATAPIQDQINKLEAKNILPSGPRSQMESVYDEALTNPLAPNNIPVAQAQDYKQSLYRDLKNQYGTLSEGGEAAKKALARGLREGIETAVPSVKPLNAEASELWNAINVSERRALMDANKQLLGGAPIAHTPTTQAIMFAQRSPYLKPALAHALNVPNLVPRGSKLAAMLGVGYESIDEPK
jgi:hypothetical protein